MSRAETMLLVRGYLVKQDKEWQKTRFQAYYTYALGFQNSKKRPVPMTKFLPLSIDKKQRKNNVNINAMREGWQKMKELNGKS